MEKKKSIVKFIVTVLLLLLCLIVGCHQSKAENDIPEIPLPSQSWEDYQSQHPIAVTPEPTATPDPQPTPVPPMVRGQYIYSRCRLRYWKAYSEPTIPPPPTQMYQQLSSPYSTSTTMPGYAQIAASTVAGSRYQFSSNDRSGSQPVLNGSDSVINGIDSYICFCWEFRFQSSTTVTIGEGLDYGRRVYFSMSYPVIAVEHSTGTAVWSLPVMVVCHQIFDNGDADIYEFKHTIRDLNDGISWSCDSNRKDRKLNKVEFWFFIGLDPDGYEKLTPDQRASATLYEVYSGGQYFIFTTYTADSPADLNSVHSAIIGIWDSFPSLIVPDQETFENWIATKVNQLDQSSSTMLYYNAYLQMLSDIVSSEPQDFLLKVPALKLTVGGVQYTYFDGYTYNMSDADIQLTGQSQTLFYYTRLVGDVVIVGGFVFGHLYKLWKRIFDIEYASGSGGDNE